MKNVVKTVLGVCVVGVVAGILIMSSCIFVIRTPKQEECPVCEECTEDKEVPLPETGSFDFFLEEEEEEMMLFYRVDNQGVCNGEGCEEIHP